MRWPILRIRTKTFRLILASYLLVLLVPLVLGIVLFRGVVRVVREEALRASQAGLEKGRDAADAELRSLDAIVFDLARSQKVNAVLTVKDAMRGSEIYKVLDAWQELSRLRMPDLVQELFLYFSGSDIVVSPTISYVRMAYFDLSFFGSNGRSFAQWRSGFAPALPDKQWLPSQTIAFRGLPSEVLTLVRTLPLGAAEQARGTVMVFVREAALEKLLCPPDDAAVSRILVVDGAGRVIAGHPAAGWAPSMLSGIVNAARHGSADPALADGRWLFAVQSLYQDWTYLLSVPDTVVMARLHRVRSALLVGLALLAIIGIAAATALAKWQTRPIREIVRALGENLRASGIPAGNEYDQVRATVLGLLEGNRDLAMALQRQTPLVRHSFLSRLVKGELADRRQIEVLAGEAGVDLRGPRFLALVAVFPTFGELTPSGLAALGVTRAAYRSAAECRIPSRCYVVETGVDELCIILSLEVDSAVRALAQVQAVALRDPGVEEPLAPAASRGPVAAAPVVAAGTVAEDVMGICVSYANARTAARCSCRGSLESGSLVFFDDLPRDSASYYYPLGIENRIVTLAHQGDAAAIEDLLAMLYRENFEQRQLSPQAVEVLVAEMRATVAKAVGDGAGLDAAGPLVRLGGVLGAADAESPREPREIFNAFAAAFRSICRTVEDRHRTHSRRLREEILKHVSSTFTDPNLCLQSIATRFRLSPFYVSEFFKEQVGENFHQHLERLRLEAACQLLRGTELPIAEIARKTGYANLSTFRKAFRRVVGASPRDMRQNVAGSGFAPGARPTT